jgi:hypothetical protein
MEDSSTLLFPILILSILVFLTYLNLALTDIGTADR